MPSPKAPPGLCPVALITPSQPYNNTELKCPPVSTVKAGLPTIEPAGAVGSVAEPPVEVVPGIPNIDLLVAPEASTLPSLRIILMAEVP